MGEDLCAGGIGDEEGVLDPLAKWKPVRATRAHGELGKQWPMFPSPRRKLRMGVWGVGEWCGGWGDVAYVGDFDVAVIGEVDAAVAVGDEIVWG